MGWHVCSAAAIGSSHLDIGLPCQDACASACDGDLLVAVVCDGAGSRARSDTGAQLMSQEIVTQLLASLRGGEVALSSVKDLQPLFATAIGTARDRLVVRAVEDHCALEDYAATVVGVVADAAGGVFFHIGDGIGAALAPGGSCVISTPENGEYANETYFVTGQDWLAHLRITPFTGPADVLLMSDGAMPFVMARGVGDVYRPFVDPVLAYLRAASEADGCAALAATLDDPRTRTITSDDKTLLVAIRT